MRFMRWWWLLPILLVSFWFGARHLDTYAIWNDEWYMIRDAQVSHNPIEIAGHLAVQNPWHAPSYYVILNLWGRLNDWNPVPLRAMALFIGMLAIAWTYRLGRDHMSPRVGLYGAAILAFSEFFTHYMTQARMYTLTVALTAFIFWFYLRLIRLKREPSRWVWLAFGASVTFILYTHYFLVLPLAAVSVYHLLFVRKNRRWWKVVAAMAVAGALFLPYVSAVLKAFSRASSRDLEELMTGTDMFAWASFLFSNGYSLLFVGFGALALLALARWHGRARHGLAAMWVFLAVMLLAIFALSFMIEIFAPGRARYLIFLWGLLATLIAAGMVQLGQFSRRGLQRVVPLAALVVWLALAAWSNLNPTVTTDLPGPTLTFPVHVVMRELDPLHRPGDYILNVVPDDNRWERYGHNVLFYVERVGLAADSVAIGRVDDPAQREDILQSVRTEMGAGREYVWLAYRTDPEPAPLSDARALVSEQYTLCGAAVERADYSLRIDEYTRSPVCCTPDVVARPPMIDYGNGLRLMGADVQPSGDGLQVHVSWSGASAMPPDTYSVGLHVLDANGDLVAQTDAGLPTSDFICEQKQIDLSGVPAGDYTVVVIVYDWRTNARLTGTLVESGAQSDALPISDLMIGENRGMSVG